MSGFTPTSFDLCLSQSKRGVSNFGKLQADDDDLKQLVILIEELLVHLKSVSLIK